ncbi:response regulator transcription factor [Synechocystis sp. PCC 7339]|uniref:two-component system response regulator RppA n=1 Tax=unclassified Synechocystis TaxID=2640012 RepID=UPI001BAEC999|nr:MULTISPECIES: two-component system response regulator RppA [unclassified Synechocystis]QUS60902.1 response regulator transcription factor [Synechocystis sp. PCC 7338]UAJ73087.1 response regulator transcription factor [Synechocystis sp. PCC 7339]
MRLLLVEDEPDLGMALEKTLRRENYIVDWVQEGNMAWSYLDQGWVNYTLAVFDWMVPGLSGIELCHKLRAQGSSLPILILTAKDRMEDRVRGLDAGADDYLIKPFGMAELLARLRSLQRRSPQLQPQHLQVGGWQLDYGSFVVITPGRQKTSLTAKEFQLLECLMKHPQQILSSEQIKNQLWAVSVESTSNVVAAQVRLLRRKLGQYGHVIETVYGLGYRFQPHQVHAEK